LVNTLSQEYNGLRMWVRAVTSWSALTSSIWGF